MLVILLNLGKILVRGQLEGKYTDIRLVHSMADIEAKVWHTKKKKDPLIQEVSINTGKQEKKYSIVIKKNTINLFKTLSKFEKYDTISVEKKVMLFSNFYLPIKIIKTVNNEYKLEEKRYSKEELTNVLIDELYSELIKDIKNENSILNKSINTYEDNGYIEVELTLETIEKIGIESELNF